MEYDFDRITDRGGTGCLKYDFAVQRGRPADVLPMWVADMDFPTAPCVQEALQQMVAHGIFGYSESGAAYFDAVASWFSRRFGFTPEADWLVKTPGVVYALAAAVRCLTTPEDAVVIFSPVYYPFSEVVRDNGRTLVESCLLYENGTWQIDFADLERKLAEPDVKLLLFCSPHNPVGRVWTRAELEQVSSLCETYDVLIVSDEIHCDFVWPGHQHIVFPTLSEAATQRTILCTAPTKTFNLAGLQISNCFIPNPEIRRRFNEEKNRTGYSQCGGPGLVACQAAYEKGEEWLEALKTYIQGNFEYLQKVLEEDLPQLRLTKAEGTYLAWIDCSGLGLNPEELENLILYEARLWLDSGAMFGSWTAQFQRMNVACPRTILEQALQQLRAAVSTL